MYRISRMNSLRIHLLAVVTILIVAVMATTPAIAQQEKVLHTFSFTTTDAATPWSGLIFDKAGNLFGTSSAGGTSNSGTVYELTPTASGAWRERVLHSFSSDGVDGTAIYNNVTLDTSGNLFGVAYFGGANDKGAVFELSPQTGGGWTEKILYSFDGKGPVGGGANPFGSLIIDNKGNLYGTALYGGRAQKCGGSLGCGVVFELSPKQGGGWAEKVLHSFAGNGTDGASPLGALVVDSKRNIYGVAYSGGLYNLGMIFELTPGSGGTWVEKDLHDFDGSATDGASPLAGLTIDRAGNLYGTTYQGGIYNNGTVFELTRGADGSWTQQLLHSFGGSGDGASPYYGTLTFDHSGNLYGTTFGGGTSGNGTAFELTPVAAGTWTETVLTNFTSAGGDGGIPYGGLALDGGINLYGTTYSGGSDGSGTVFEILR
jgi:uncharacterized repeat protein (TIGR03803 family)